MVAKIRLPLLALLLSAVSLASSAMADDPNEPNDIIDQATSSGLDGIGTVTIEGVEITNLASSTDVDLYSFTISSGTLPPVLVTASLETAESTLDGYLRLFTSDGVELANNDDDDYPDVDAVLTTFLLTEGTYYLGVSSTGVSTYDAITGSIRTSGSEGPYALTITTEAAKLPDSPFEPNDVQPTWTGLGVGTFEALGEFIGDGENDRDDVDLYKFEVAVPILVTIDVTAAHLGATLDPVVELISLVSNATIAINSHARLDTFDARIEVALFDTNLDAYEVKITGGHRPQSVGPYDLRITTTPLEMSGPGTLEPNDSILVATPTGLSGAGTVTLSAYIGDGSFAETVGDVDFYEFQAVVGDVITIEAFPDGPESELDPIVGLYAFFGERTGFDDNGGGGSSSRLSELICSAIEPDGCLCPSDADEVTAYAMVMGTRQRFPIDALARHLDFDPAWPIQNTFDGGPGSVGDYTITMTVTAEAAGCAAEPNDSIEDAVSTELSEGVRYVCRSGALGDGACEDPLTDVDMWSVEVVNAPALVTVEVASLDCVDEIGTTLRLFDSDGLELASDDPGPARDARLVVTVTETGAYVVGLSTSGNQSYDPKTACSGEIGGPAGEYGVSILVTPLGLPPAPSTPDPDSPGDDRVFASRLDRADAWIDELDPDTGAILSSIPSPDAVLGGGESLAYGEGSLWYRSIGWYPTLYQLDPDTGSVLQSVRLWSGSGYYDDAVVLGDQLYLLDLADGSIHAMNLDLDAAVGVIDFSYTHDVSLSGGLGAKWQPDRLYAADAFGSGVVYVIDPATGTTIETLAPTGICGCSADFDGDGDVDSADREFLTQCAALGPGVQFGCAPADLDCDGDVDEDDLAIEACQNAGAGNPPNEDCCPQDLPGAPRRAAALAGLADGRLLAGGWQETALLLLDACDDLEAQLEPDFRLGSLAADVYLPGPEGDCNENGIPDECDILDGNSEDGNDNGIPDECEVTDCEGDVNGDGVVDPLDSGFVLARFGCPVGTGDPDCDLGDANGDGVVDPLDVGYVLSRFGPCDNGA